jgi:hypothetical protein
LAFIDLCPATPTDSNLLTGYPEIRWGAAYDIVPHVGDCKRHRISKPQECLSYQVMPLHEQTPACPGEVIWKVKDLSGDMTCQDASQTESLKSFSPTIPSLLNGHEQGDSANTRCNAIHVRLRPTKVSSFVVRVALQVFASLLLTWYTAPSSDTFHRLPEILRPTLLQNTSPHPSWIGIFFWPEGRDVIIRHLKDKQMEVVWALLAPSIRLCWPYTESDIFVLSIHGDRMFNPVFLRHIQDLQVR